MGGRRENLPCLVVHLKTAHGHLACGHKFKLLDKEKVLGSFTNGLEEGNKTGINKAKIFLE